MQMPAPDPHILARKSRIVSGLQEILPHDAVIYEPNETH